MPTAIRSDNGWESAPATTTFRRATSIPTIRSVGVPSARVDEVPAQALSSLLGVEQKRGEGWAKAKPRPKQPHRKRR